MTKKQRVTNELFQLIATHPGADILVCIPNTDSDEYDWVAGNFSKAWLDKVYEEDGRIYLQSQNFDELYGEIEEVVYCEIAENGPIDPDSVYKTIEEESVLRINMLDWKPTIVVELEQA